MLSRSARRTTTAPDRAADRTSACAAAALLGAGDHTVGLLWLPDTATAAFPERAIHPAQLHSVGAAQPAKRRLPGAPGLCRRADQRPGLPQSVGVSGWHTAHAADRPYAATAHQPRHAPQRQNRDLPIEHGALRLVSLAARRDLGA